MQEPFSTLRISQLRLENNYVQKKKPADYESWYKPKLSDINTFVDDANAWLNTHLKDHADNGEMVKVMRMMMLVQEIALHRLL